MPQIHERVHTKVEEKTFNLTVYISNQNNYWNTWIKLRLCVHCIYLYGCPSPPQKCRAKQFVVL